MTEILEHDMNGFHEILSDKPHLFYDLRENVMVRILCAKTGLESELYDDLFLDEDGKRLIEFLKSSTVWENLLQNKQFLYRFSLVSLEHYLMIKETVDQVMYDNVEFYIDLYDDSDQYIIPEKIFVSDVFSTFMMRMIRRIKVNHFKIAPKLFKEHINFILHTAILLKNAPKVLGSILDHFHSNIPDKIYEQIIKYNDTNLFFTRDINNYEFTVCNVNTGTVKKQSRKTLKFKFMTYVEECKYAHTKNHIIRCNNVNLITILSHIQQSLEKQRILFNYARQFDTSFNFLYTVKKIENISNWLIIEIYISILQMATITSETILFYQNQVLCDRKLLSYFPEEIIIQILCTPSEVIWALYKSLFYDGIDMRYTFGLLASCECWRKLISDEVFLHKCSLVSMETYYILKKYTDTALKNNVQFYIDLLSYHMLHWNDVPSHLFKLEKFAEYVKSKMHYNSSIIHNIADKVFTIEFIEYVANFFTDPKYRSNADEIVCLAKRIPEKIYDELQAYNYGKIFFTNDIGNYRFSICDEDTKLEIRTERYYNFSLGFKTYVRECPGAHNGDHIVRYNNLNLLTLINNIKDSKRKRTILFTYNKQYDSRFNFLYLAKKIDSRFNFLYLAKKIEFIINRLV